MKTKRGKLFIIVALVISMSATFALSACGNKDTNPTEDPNEFVSNYHMQRFTQADTIYVVKSSTDGLSTKNLKVVDELILQSIQGIVSQRKAELFIGTPRDKFLREAKKNYNLTLDDGSDIYYMDDSGLEAEKESNTQWLSSLIGIIGHYIETGDIKGYVKMRFVEDSYDQQVSQVNQACTLAGLNQWIIVPEQGEAIIKENFPDLPMGFDLSTTQLSEYDVIKENIDKLNKDVLIIQAPLRVKNLLEYGIASQAPFYFYNPSTPYEEKDFVYTNLNMLANGFGWQQVDAEVNGVKYGVSEIESVDFASQRDVNIIAADWCTNLSFWSSLPTEQFKQKETVRVASEDDEAHYLTFLYSDGDNIQWMQGGGFANDFFGQTKAEDKKMPFGWTATPNLVDVDPSMLRYLYENMTDKEHFVVSVSGYAYNHPGLLSREAMEYNSQITSKMMGQADMQYVAMKGINSQVMQSYANQENVDGGFIMYGKDIGRAGHIYWYNDKPFVHDRIILWKDSGEWADPSYVAKNIEKINNFSTDKTNTGAYTFIQVHAWSYRYGELQKVFMENLNDNVKVVAPNEFMELIKDNIDYENDRYTIPK